MTKFVILTIWLARNPFLKRWQLIRNYAGTLLFNISNNICFGYLLESPHQGDSNKYLKHTFYEELRIKHGICCISFCSLRIHYNSKFILMAVSLGTNAVIVTRVHCTKLNKQDWSHLDIVPKYSREDNLQTTVCFSSVIPFEMGATSWRKELASRGSNFCNAFFKSSSQCEGKYFHVSYFPWRYLHSLCKW